MRKRQLPIALWRLSAGVLSLALVVAAGGDATAQVPDGFEPGDRHLGQALEVFEGVPIDVRRVVVTRAGVEATFANVSSQPIVAYQVALASGGEAGPLRLAAVSSATDVLWQPGVENSVLLPSRPLSAPRVLAMAAILADGSAFGEPAAIERFRRDARERQGGLSGVLTLLAEAPVPATEVDLQALIEDVALAMARVPVGRSGTLKLEPYMRTVAELKRLSGRDMVGTERFQREYDAIRSRLHQDLSRMPTAVTTTRHPR